MWETPLKTIPNQQEDPSELPTQDPMKYLTVTCRLKPLLPNENRSKIEIDKLSHAITLNDPTKSISKTYTFDEIFDECACQDLFTNNVCQPIVQFLKKGGQSGLIFSYGITNSGKTYTILGTKQQPGILLTLIKKLEDQFKGETLKIVACELYKDEFFSLKNKGEKLQPKEMRGTFSFQECHSDIINENNMEELFCQYLMNRSCSSTSQNSTSSRSHAIFKISTSKFKIGIVDLAGSERTSKGQMDSHDIKETIFINSSLLTLKKCIKALEERSHFTQKICVPYRESKLTQALMEYFVPNAKINIIVNINQARHCLEQNLNVMDYTSKAKNITANATSDFSLMLKSTAKKKEALISALKSHKNSKSQNKQPLHTHSMVFNSKSVFSKTVSNLSQNSQSQQNTQKTQQIYEAYKSLESIEEQNERKPSEYISTAINSHSDDLGSSCMIEEIQYEQFNPVKQQNQHKLRYSVQFQGQPHKYIIEEEMMESQELSASLMMEIQTHERNSFIQKKSQQQTFQQLMEKPLSIEEFIQRQEIFRNYLSIDRQLEAEADARKLSALKKVNLFETTKKKQNAPEFYEKTSTERKSMAVGTQDFIRQTDDLNDRLSNIEFEKLRTNVKKRLLQVLDEEKRKMLVDADTSYSYQKKTQVEHNHHFRELNVDQTEDQQEESNFTTPSKNHSKNNKNIGVIPQQNQTIVVLNSNVNKSILKKTFEKVTSGVKYMADKVGLGNHIFRTNNKEIKSFSEEKMRKKNTTKCDLKIWKEISERIDPHNKISYEVSTNTEVDIFPSVKKVRQVEGKDFLGNDNNAFEVDAYPELGEKFEQITCYEVGIQTQNVQVKFVLQQAIEEVMNEENKKKNDNFQRRNKRNFKEEKLINEQRREEEQKIPQTMQKTAFKHFSVKKDHPGFSLKKRQELVSNAKIAIAKNTRAAQRRRQGPN